MKKLLLLLGFVFVVLGCKKTVVDKPDRLIDEQTMAGIIYDLSVLEAMKSRESQVINNSTSGYVYLKYNVDSVQFAQSNQYYAAEIDKYKKIYEMVNARIEKEKRIADSLSGKAAKTAPNDMPQIK